MESSSVAEQRATAVAKLKRAASLPRMKDGRRPPMHVEAVSEGERVDHDVEVDEESAQDSDEKRGLEQEQEQAEEQEQEGVRQSPGTEAPNEEDGKEEEKEEEKVEDVAALPPTTPIPTDSTPTRAKRRSRSRTRSRGSRDMKGKAMAKQSPHLSSASHTNESSADEYSVSVPGDDAPPSPPLVSPIPSHFPLPASRFLVSPFFYPGTTPSTPLPTLDDIQKGMTGKGLYRSNSAGAARAMAMQKLTGGTETLDFAYISSSPTPPPDGVRLMRNNTVSGGERMAARRMMLDRIGHRFKEADWDQTSGGEEAAPPILPPKRRRRRSKRNSSRASTVVDDREEREPPSTTPNTPVVPPSPRLPSFHNAPDPPRPPSSASRVGNGDVARPSPVMKTNGTTPYDYETMGHRGVVVEEEDDVPERVSPQRLPLPHPPSTPARGYGSSTATRVPHTSDAPSNTSTDSAPASAIGVPVFFSRKTGYGQDLFPASPFATPLKEKAYLDEEEEEEIFQDVRRRPWQAFERESEISWVAEPVQERIPLHDDDEDEGEDDTLEPEGGEHPAEVFEPRSDRHHDRVPPRTDLVVDLETSPEPTSAHIVPSPISPIVPLDPTTNDAQVTQVSPTTYPARLSVVTPSQMDRSPSSTDFPDWEDTRATVTDATIKRAGEATSTWEKMKNALALGRSGSVNGRRSRTNSIGLRDRRNNTDSSISRESRGSISREKSEQQNFDLQAPSASASISSLPIAPQIGVLSPVPAATQADMIIYGYESNSKLNPFPGLKQLKEQRNRAKGMTPSASNPDVVPSNGLGMEAVPSSSSSNTATRSLEPSRERKLSHQASDSRLLPKFNNNAVSPPSASSVSASPLQTDYFNIPIATTSGTNATGISKLPMNREGVKKWLINKRLLPSQSPPVATPSVTTPPVVDSQPRTDLPTDREILSHDKSRTPTNAPDNTLSGMQRGEEVKPIEVHTETVVFASHGSSPETIQSPRQELHMEARTNGVVSPSHASEYSFPSPRDHPSSTTPDPQSSLDDFPTRSTSESFSDTMSSSHHSPDPPNNEPSASTIVLERLEELLGRGSKSSFWPSAIDDPPRKLVLSSPVLQVANANTVKDRFLFLFNDILVIAKPIVQDKDTLLDTMKPSPLDRRFIVKSVCPLRELRFSGERDEGLTKVASSLNPMRHPVIRGFVHQFAKDPDHAVSALFSKTTSRDDPIALGQLLFRTLDLDRSRLGEYLSRRTSKVVLKAFIDSFGLTGLRIDKALRVFLQAIHIPARSAVQPGALEYLLDSFASRWYEANAGVVAYDKDLAVRLVRAIVQLNEVMHGGIAHEPGVTGYPKRNVIAGDFVSAFRRYDSRGLVSDDLLDKIYTSIRRERLSQARNPSTSNDSLDIPITIKRPLPSRLTYRVQSEPVVLRIPQPDPQLTIQLFGQDVAFDPPMLNFARSAEASFRVTGTSLGAKSIIMWRSGPNGLLYAGLPLSSSVMVERAFMRNTFQVAFVNHNNSKRKYMFSVDDPLIRHQWTVSLKQQIDIASSSVSPADASGSSSKVQKATDNLALRVLQETLINSEEDDYSSVPLSPVDQALARLTGVPPIRHAPHESISSSRAGSSAANGNGVTTPRRKPNGTSPHVRSKSRSQMYHRHGAGKFELDLNDSPGLQSDDERAQYEVPVQSQQQRLWSGRDLEMICRQNSLVPPVLTYLHYGRREHDVTNGTAT